MKNNRIPKIHFYRTRITETVVLLFTASCIYNSFFLKNNFFVLPYLAKNCNKSIYFPRFTNTDKNFWKNSLKLFEEVHNNTDPYVKRISAQIPFTPVNYEQLSTLFQKSIEIYWSDLVKTWPDFFGGVKKIDIYVSEYGAVASQYSSFLNNPSYIRIFVRYDSNIKEIYKMIFFERIRLFRHYVKYQWSEIMAVCESFVNDTFLQKINSEEYRTLTSTRGNKSGNMAIESQQYLKELGFGLGGQFTIRLGEVIFNEEVIPLPKFPKVFLSTLIEQYPEIVTYENIAQQLWMNEWVDKFSIESITQIVKRTRTLLKERMINPSVIQSIRGKGYVLINNP